MSKKAKRKTVKRKASKGRSAAYTVLALVLFGAAIYGLIQWLRVQDEALAGTRYPDMGRGHVPQCVPQYNSTPPTSGCHQPTWAPWEISDAPIPDGLQVHNLEHGGIMVQYRPDPIPGLPGAHVEDLQAFVQELRQQRKYCKVILAPYPGLQDPIALTAWGWLQTLDEFDETAVKRFIDDHLEKGPELNTPCP